MSAYLVSCGDMDNTHGEACDDGVGGSDSCTSECHIVFDNDQSGGMLPAVSTTRAEATFLDTSTDGDIEIVTPLGGDQCSFPAVMAVRVDAPDGLQPQTLTVNNIDCEQGNFVDDGAGGEMDIATDAYQIDLFDDQGDPLNDAERSEPFLGRNCAQIRFTPEAGSGNRLFFLEVRPTRPEVQAPTLRVRTVVR